MTREKILKIIYNAEKEKATGLDLSEYKIIRLPKEIGRLTSLQSLILRGLKELPPEIGKLRNLTRLYLSSNELTRLPEELFRLTNLTRLYLSANQLTELPKEIGLLKHLEILDLNFNDLSELPKTISRLKNLSILYLSANGLTELPDEIAQLANLTILDMSSNNISELPPAVTRLRNLTRLYLSANRLKSLPRDIARLKNLSILDLNSNRLNQLPKEITRLRNLTILDLNSNQLNRMPQEIAQLKNLTELNLSSNQFREIPPEITRLRNLTRLYLSFNELTRVPETIAMLRNLTRVDLTSNQLTRLPPEIGNLGNLTVLYLDSNQITELPREVVKLENLIHLDVNRNPLTFPPAEIGAQGVSAIMDYLKNSDRGGQTLYEAKLLIVGQGGVGKTCLINRLISGQYAENQRTTEGIDIKTWKVTAPSGAKTEMTLNVWDFGGQEIYHATHQFFLTRRSLYLLVWDARQEEEYGRIAYWLNTVETAAGESPILIVMNKADERDKDLNIKELRQLSSKIIASRKVSARKGTGIEALRQFIRKYAWELPLMGTFWPAPWLAVRRELEAAAEHFMPHKRYLRICKKAGIGEKEGHTLSRYLHDLGIILHFQDDRLLKDIIILKPEWGTDAVYKVLDSELVQKRGGILYYKDLPGIWTDRKLYPKDQYTTIIRLMANFELAFPFGPGDRYIVAEFLPLEEADYDWNPSDPLQFEYHYDFLPAGIMTRLIVRMNEFLTEHDGKKLCWREGGYFSANNAQAMVRMNTRTRVGVIQVDGTGKRDLLEEIRSHFETIHKTIRKIQVKETVPCSCSPGCDHRLDYKFLLKCEEKGIKEVLCEKSAAYVHVKNLLDRIEKPEVRWDIRKERPGDIYNLLSDKPDTLSDVDTGPRPFFLFFLIVLLIISILLFIQKGETDYIGIFLKQANIWLNYLKLSF